MKKLTYVFAISVIASGFLGCGEGTKNADGNADSVNAAIDTAPGAMSHSDESLESPAGEFAKKAALGGMTEVEASQLAVTKSTNPQIKDFARMMVTDHSKANEELKAIAKMKNMSLPASLDEEHQKKVDELNKKTGSDFDQAYVSLMVDDHKETLELMQEEAKDGKDSDLKAFAVKTAPVVQAHLDMITKIRDSMK